LEGEYVMARNRSQSGRRDDLAERGSRMMESVQEAGGSAQRMASEQLENLRDTASEYWEEGREKAREVGETLQEQVRNEPMVALLVAAAAGFLVGVYFVRR